MAGAAVTELLRVTATHEADAWVCSIVAGAVGAFVVLFAVGRGQGRAAPHARVGADAPSGAEVGSAGRGSRLGLAGGFMGALAGALAAAIVGAAIGATLLPIGLRLPAAIAAGSLVPLLGGDRMAIGALVGFAIAGAIAARWSRIDPWRALDRLAPSTGVLVVAGRIGCFLEGCDFGEVTSVGWGVRYPAGSHAFEHHVARGLVSATDAASLLVHPVQLYEVLVGLAMIAIAIGMLRRDARPRASFPERADAEVGRRSRSATAGRVLRVTLGVYAIGRLAIEPFRGDPRPALGALSLPQWLAVALLAWCLAGLLDGARAPARARR